MKRTLLWLTFGLLLAACGSSSATNPNNPAPKPGTVTVEVVYLNHPPVRPVLQDVNKLLATYGNRVSGAWYDFDTPAGADFAKAKGLTGHTPLAIYINGSMDFKLDGRAVKFSSFPQGQDMGMGMVADGDWTIQDLQRVLDQATSK
jgi:hypothetical protein